MHIDPKGETAGYPALLVRKVLRNLRTADGWSLLALEEAAKLPSGTGLSMAKALQKQGLIELTDPGRWTVTQAGRTSLGWNMRETNEPSLSENSNPQREPGSWA